MGVTQITGLSSMSGSVEVAGGCHCLHSYRHMLSWSRSLQGARGLDSHCLLFPQIKPDQQDEM